MAKPVRVVIAQRHNRLLLAAARAHRSCFDHGHLRAPRPSWGAGGIMFMRSGDNQSMQFFFICNGHDGPMRLARHVPTV